MSGMILALGSTPAASNMTRLRSTRAPDPPIASMYTSFIALEWDISIISTQISEPQTKEEEEDGCDNRIAYPQTKEVGYSY